MHQDEGPYQQAANALKKSNTTIAITGAGASVESGIPDFRSPGGLWETYPPEEFATIDGYLQNPDHVWPLWYELGQKFAHVKPNPGHHALAQLERLGHLNTVITQNIDNLHQAAGNTHVIEYHGNGKSIACLQCQADAPFDNTLSPDHAPRCPCGGLMKPQVIFFGEPIPTHALTQSEHLAQTADTVLIIGTSATVYPAAAIAQTAKQHGAYIIECNLQPTDYTPTITNTFLQGKAGQTLPKLLTHITAVQDKIIVELRPA